MLRNPCFRLYSFPWRSSSGISPLSAHMQRRIAHCSVICLLRGTSLCSNSGLLRGLQKNFIISN